MSSYRIRRVIHLLTVVYSFQEYVAHAKVGGDCVDSFLRSECFGREIELLDVRRSGNRPPLLEGGISRDYGCTGFVEPMFLGDVQVEIATSDETPQDAPLLRGTIVNRTKYC